MPNTFSISQFYFDIIIQPSSLLKKYKAINCGYLKSPLCTNKNEKFCEKSLRPTHYTAPFIERILATIKPFPADIRSRSRSRWISCHRGSIAPQISSLFEDGTRAWCCRTLNHARPRQPHKNADGRAGGRMREGGGGLGCAGGWNKTNRRKWFCAGACGVCRIGARIFANSYQGYQPTSNTIDWHKKKLTNSEDLTCREEFLDSKARKNKSF